MIISNPVLDGLRTTFGMQFWAGYNGAETYYQELTTAVPSNSKSNTYGWIAQSVAMRKWLGPRVAQNLSEHEYALVNDDYEATIEVDRNDIEDDNLGMYTSMLFPQLGEAYRKHPDVLLTSLLAANPTAFDGGAFFRTGHPTYSGSTTYDNDYTTTALTAANFNTVWSAMASIVGEDGQPLGVMPNLLVVPPQLKLTALQIMQSTTYASATSPFNLAGQNMLQGWAKVLVVPQLAGTPGTWYLLDTTKAIKPFLYQLRRAGTFVARDKPDDPKVFDLKKFTYGVDCRDAMGVSLPFLAARAAA